VSELITNAVRRGPAGQEHRIGLSVDRSETSLRVEVLDEGHGLSSPTSTSSRPDEHGRGLMIVESLASASGVEEDATGSKVWAELSLPRPEHVS
jgi:anti-sigma regulatory factor (Ser/Thr protein kinase)